jgi:hypothetical protein
MVLLVAACATDVGQSTTTESSPSTNVDGGIPDTSSPDDGSTTSTPPGQTTTTSDREIAPDFTLELGDGGEYTLSEGEKPVYLVFWAEW